MKHLILYMLFFLASCANHRQPASVGGHPAAYDSMAMGNIKASAIKKNEGSETCFEVKLSLTGTRKSEAEISNWTVAWVDNNKQYHLINIQQRGPASAPQGGLIAAQYGEFQQWSNEFVACTPKARLDDVKSLILTPKSNTYANDKGLELNWK